MIIYDISFQSPLENILCDEMLLQRAEQESGDDVLRLWESPVSFVVLGLIGKVEEDVKVDCCRRDGIDIFRRSSGGGTVVQGLGCLNFSFILSKERAPALNDLHQSYQEVLTPVIDIFKTLGVEAEFQPISDLALTKTKKKFSGNAQRRMKKNILHHGTVLCNFDLFLIEKYLTMPESVPEYRADRSHLEFVDNIGLNSRKVRDVFFQYFKPSSVVTQLNAQEKNALDRLLLHDSDRISLS